MAEGVHGLHERLVLAEGVCFGDVRKRCRVDS